MKVHIFKSGIDVQSGVVKGLEGAEFAIKLASEVEEAYAKGYSYEEVWNGIDRNGNKVNVDSKRVTEAQAIAPTYSSVLTDENGDGYSISLPYGRYIGKEMKTPKDFETASDFYFSITQDESEVHDIAKKVKHIYINNEQLETYIKLVKKDKTTGKVVTASSATFKIKAAEDIYDRGNNQILYRKGEFIKQKIGSKTYSNFTTNADSLIIPADSYTNKEDDKGTVVTPLKLEVGSYELFEVKEPDGFLILGEPIKFEVRGIRDYDQDKDGDFLLTIEAHNEQPTGTLIIDKSVVLRNDINTSLIDVSDLSGIQFRLSAKENVIDKADNSIIYEAGKEIGVYNLSKDGDLKIEGLPLGCFELQEIKTLDGLILNDKKYEIRFTQKDNTTKVYTETLNIENETTCFEFSKVDITGDKELVGAGLEVIDENNKVVDSWVSSEVTHKIEGLVVGKSYTLVERIAVEGYVKATAIKFTVKSTTEIQKVQMIDKIVEISKVDIAGEEIEGATLQVIDKNDNIVDEWVSGKNPHKVNGLVEGEKYRLHEEICVDGFVKATDIEFAVTTDKETQKIVMIDKVVEISKVDVAGEEIEGATLQVIDKDDNIVDEWVSGKIPHKVNGLIEGEQYKLHEEIASEGFVIATDIEFTVTMDKETQKIQMVDKIVEVSKVNISGEEIEGATLQVLDKEGNIVDKWTSEKTPHKVKGLKEGEQYILHEELCVDGYVKATDIEFTVTLDKEIQKIEMTDKIVLVSKIDSITGEVLEGAYLKVVDEENNILDSWVSSKEPHPVVGLEENKKYWLVEDDSPYGYLIAEKIEFEVSEDKQTQEIVMEDMPILKTLQVIKIDEDTNEIIKDKFVFGLYEDESCTKLIKKVKSNKETGSVTFEDLRYGIIFLKELSAPKGYQLSNKIIKIEINDNGVFADEVVLEDNNSICTLNYSNKQIPKIQTGNEINYLLLIGIIIFSLLGISIGIIILKKLKRN